MDASRGGRKGVGVGPTSHQSDKPQFGSYLPYASADMELQTSSHAQRVLIDIDVLTPLVAILTTEDAQATPLATLGCLACLPPAAALSPPSRTQLWRGVLWNTGETSRCSRAESSRWLLRQAPRITSAHLGCWSLSNPLLPPLPPPLCRTDALARDSVIIHPLLLAIRDLAVGEPAVAISLLQAIDTICSLSTKGLTSLQAVGPTLLNDFLSAARRHLLQLKRSYTPLSKLLFSLSKPIAGRCSHSDGGTAHTDSPLTSRAAREVRGPLIDAICELLAECARRAIAVPSTLSLSPPSAITHQSAPTLLSTQPAASPARERLANKALRVVAITLGQTRPDLSSELSTALGCPSPSQRRARSAGAGLYSPEIATPQDTGPSASPGEAGAIEQCCYRLCEAIDTLWACSAHEGRESIVDGAASAIHSLAKHKAQSRLGKVRRRLLKGLMHASLLTATASRRIAWSLLDLFGFHVSDHHQLSQLAVSEEEGFGLAAWWRHDDSLRVAEKSAGVSPAPSDKSDGASPKANHSPHFHVSSDGASPRSLMYSEMCGRASPLVNVSTAGPAPSSKPLVSRPEPPQALLFRSRQFNAFPGDVSLEHSFPTK
ncbi:MAG: hypothetical protein SGPRY_004278 [Prymnesium sp.]